MKIVHIQPQSERTRTIKTSKKDADRRRVLNWIARQEQKDFENFIKENQARIDRIKQYFPDFELTKESCTKYHL